MKKTILFITILLTATNLFAQQTDSTLVKEISSLKNTVFQQGQEINALNQKLPEHQNLLDQSQKELDELTNKIVNQNSLLSQQSQIIEGLENENKNIKATVDSLNQLIQTNSHNIVTNSKELGTKIQKTRTAAETQISQLDNDVDKNRLYWIIATLVILLLGGLIYWLLKKRIASNKTDVETQIRNTKKSLEEESIKLDNKLVEVLETQLKIKQEETKTQSSVSNEKADHSLALKVADEIIRIQKNLSRMDENTKGLKQLNSSVKRIQDNFASNGYELVDMVGKEYSDGMKVSANFIPSEDLETGKQIITRIIKPQVNFKGEMIQAAQIEVSVGE